ncbi:Inversin, partial [Stegodyphus mimosarum]
MQMHVAAASGNKPLLKKIIKILPLKLLETKDDLGRTPLILCILNNKYECATVLLKAGVQVDNCDNAGWTALHKAISLGRHRFVKLLLAYGSSWQQRNFLGLTPLHLAAAYPSTKCLSLILKYVKRGETDIQDSKKKTALHWSAIRSNPDHIKLLLAHGANICIPDEQGKTPLHWAAMNLLPRALNCVKLLLAKQRNLVNWQDYGGRSALHLATATGSIEIVHYLASREDCDIDILDNAFCTPLHWAAKKGLVEKVSILLNKGASHLSADGSGATPLHYAAYKNNAKIVEMFLSRIYIDDEEDLEGRTAFIWAAATQADEAVKVMAASNANINHADKNGMTALHVASMHGHVSTVQLLIRLDASVNAKDKSGMSPFLKACEFGRAAVAQILLDHAADINLVDNNGCSGLHWCALGGHANLCQILLMRGADYTAQDVTGMTPLHYACTQTGNINCVSVLLESKADPNVVDEEGKTPLHVAALSGQRGASRLLCEYNTNVNAMARTNDWLTALDCAIMKDNREVVSLLQGYDAVRAEEIKELAACKIQAWYRENRRQKKIQHFISRNYVARVLMCVVNKVFCDSKIPVASWRLSSLCCSSDFASRPLLVAKESTVLVKAAEKKCSYDDYILQMENNCAITIQRAWRRHSMICKFKKM